MIIYIIYTLIVLILIFISILAIKAIGRGIKVKNDQVINFKNLVWDPSKELN